MSTMSTMVAEPYVNHIPTMTGGVGFESLRHFYAHHFIGVNPPDFELIPVSRTVGGEFPCRRVRRPLHPHHSDGLVAARH